MKYRHLSQYSHQKSIFPIAITALTALAMPSAHAQVVWDGDTDSNWSNGLNWVGDVAPVSGDAVSFGGIVGTSPNNDLVADTVISGINLTNDGTVGTNDLSFTVIGNRITLGGNIVTTTSSEALEDDIQIGLLLDANRSLTTTIGHDLKVSGDVEGAFALNISGGGLTTLSGDNAQASTTMGTNGNLRVESDTAIGDYLNMGQNTKLYLADGVTLGAANGIHFQNLKNQRGIYLTDEGVTSAEITADVDVDVGIANGRSNAFIVGDDDTLTLSGKLTGGGNTAARLYKMGNGMLILSNGTNDYGATMRVDAGTLELQDSLALQNARLQLNGGSVVFDDATVANVASVGSLGFSGNLALETSTGGALALTIGNYTGNDNFTGVLSDNGLNGGSLIKIGSGMQTLSNANTYGGTTTISEGTLQIGTNGSLGTGDTINDAQLTFNSTGSIAYAGVISGTGNVSQIGTGTTTLSGANTYTGTTTVSGGTLDITGSTTSAITVSGGTLNVTGSLSSAITVDVGGSLSGEGSTTGDLTLASGSTLIVDPNSVGAITTTGVLNPTATVNVGIATAPTSPGAFTVLSYGTYGGVVDTDFELLNAANYRNSSFVDTSTSITLDIQSEASSWTGSDAVNPTHWDVATSQNWGSSNNLFYSLDTVTFGDVGAGAVDVQSVILANGITFENTFGNDYTFDDITADAETLSGDINITGGGDVTLNVKVTGNTLITHSGTGTLSLAGGGVANDFVGNILVDGGGILKNQSTLNNSGLGDLGNTFTFRNGSTFDLNAIVANQAYKGWGTGSFTFEDGTTLTNTGGSTNNAFNDELTFAGNVTLGGTGRFDIDDVINVTGTDIVITVNNTGDNVISGDNSAQSIGEWIINDGARIFVSNDGSLGDNSIVTINAGGTLRGNTASNTVRTIINDITLNGGTIQSAYQNSDTALAGTVTVMADSALNANVDDNDDREIHLSGAVTGAGNLTIDGGTTYVRSSSDLSGYTGDFILAHNFTRTSILRLEGGIDLTQDVIVTDTAGTKALQLVSTGGTATFSGGITINDTNDFDVNVPAATDILTISGLISGSGSTGIDKTGSGTLMLSNVNTYTGDTTVAAGTLTLMDGAQLQLEPTANGVNNQINGTGMLHLEGDIYIDLSGVDTTAGNSWLLVDVANLTETFGVNFEVKSSLGDFTNDAGIWTLDDGSNIWTFSQADGTLSLPTDAGYDTWATDNGLTLGVNDGETDDPDFDGIENVLEYILGGDPLASDLEILPGGVINGANFELTFTRSDDSELDATTSVEFGSDLLVFPTTSVIVPAGSGTVDGVTFTIEENGADADDVTASMPHGDVTEFFGSVSGALNP